MCLVYKGIYITKYSFKYILFEGTDLDIDIAIDDAGRLVEKVTNVVNYLNQYFDKYHSRRVNSFEKCSLLNNSLIHIYLIDCNN